MKDLSAQDRAFFSLVAQAAFANPFGQERALLDGTLGETRPDDPQVLERVSARLSAHLHRLSEGGALHLSAYAEADQELLSAALLFDAFHRFASDLDAFIVHEMSARGGPSKAAFAEDLLRSLCGRGVSAKQAVRVLELFYQMRRAHSSVATRLLGTGASMRKVREALWNSLFTRDIRRYERFLWSRMEDFSTLLVGETGTGKGEAALAIGCSGFIPFDEDKRCFRERFDSLLVPLHLSEHPESLIESELFGHRKGAFTGAFEHHEGVLARTKPHGTLFLDEIGEASLPVQVKLLRVLQERTYTPVGGREPQRFAGRIVAATHRPLDALRNEGRMRDDFFYRLSTHTIQLPSLRTRLDESPGELALLVAHLCARIVGEPCAGLSEEVCATLVRDLGTDHPFPGNVRELEQCVRRVLLAGSCAERETAAEAASHPLPALLAQLRMSADELLSQYCGALYARHQNFVEVARITGLDRRTVKKYVDRG